MSQSDNLPPRNIAAVTARLASADWDDMTKAANESPNHVSSAERWTRLARETNPALSDDQAARLGEMLCREHYHRMGKLSAQARKLARDAQSELEREIEAEPQAANDEDMPPSTWPPGARNPGTPFRPEFLALVRTIYKQAQMDGRDPLEAVREAGNTTEETARRWITRAISQVPKVASPVFSGTKLRAARIENALSLEKLAAGTGISASSLGAYEHDRAVPTVNAAAALAGILGVGISELMDSGSEAE